MPGDGLNPPGTTPAARGPEAVGGGAALAGLGAAGFCAGFYALNHGFFFVDDFQTHALPNFLTVARGWLAGQPPLLTQGSWYAGALAGEIPAGLWSPVLTACGVAATLAGLSLPAAAALFAAVHEGVLAAGVFALARRLGLPAHAAATAAMAGALNGYVFVWGARDWIYDLASFAWLPWLWWALLRPGSALGAVVPAGVAIALMITTGWPFTLVAAASLTAALAADAWLVERRVAALTRFAAAWLVGVGLAAPALAMWIAQLAASHRAGTGLFADPAWRVPLAALPGLVLPAVHAEWFAFVAQVRKPAHELAGGLVPLAALLAAALARTPGFWRARRVELLLLGIFGAASLLPGLWNFRWPFRWLPMVHLTLALIGAAALAAVPRTGRAGPGLVALALVLATWAAAAWGAGDASPLLWATGIGYVLLTAAWAASERLAPGQALARWAPPAVVAGTLAVTYLLLPLERPPQGKWRVEEAIREPAPFERGRGYLVAITPPEQDQAARAGWPLVVMRLGNLPMLAGLEVVNGYSNMGPRGLERAFELRNAGTISVGAAAHVLARELGPDGWLRLMGVDGLVVGPLNASRHRPPAGWRVVHAGVDGELWHREGPPAPLFRALGAATTVATPEGAIAAVFARPADAPPAFVVAGDAPAGASRAYGPATLARMSAAAPDRLLAEVQTGDRPALLAVTRAYYPGWRAWVAGAEVPVRALNGVQLAVEVPAGVAGRLEVRYRPWPMVWGLWASGLTLVALLVLGYWRPRAR